MTTLVVLIVYITGVCAAYFQIQKWTDHEIAKGDEYQTLFMLSLFSWLVYPVYWIVCIARKCWEE